MKVRVRVTLAAGAALLAASVASAHHSVNAEFDTSKTVTISGTICGVELYNPHSNLYVNVKLPNGQAETWRVQLAAPNKLADGGISRDSFRPGDSITVEANVLKTAPSSSPAPTLFYSSCQSFLANTLLSGYAREITLSTGRRVQFSVEQPVMVTVTR